MEKMGVVRPDVTPENVTAEAEAKTADCTKSAIVDNNKLKIEELDNDFRKQAAKQVTEQLNS
jgi:hypothetical protein